MAVQNPTIFNAKPIARPQELIAEGERLISFFQALRSAGDNRGTLLRSVVSDYSAAAREVRAAADAFRNKYQNANGMFWLNSKEYQKTLADWASRHKDRPLQMVAHPDAAKIDEENLATLKWGRHVLSWLTAMHHSDQKSVDFDL